MRIESSKPFAARQIDAGAAKFESEAGLPEFFQYSQPFEFHKVVEKSRPEATGRFSLDKPDKMGSAVVVPVEFFRERTLLFCNINGRANRINHQKIVEAARDSDLCTATTLSRGNGDI